MRVNFAWIMILTPVMAGSALGFFGWALNGDRLAAAAGILLLVAAIRLVKLCVRMTVSQ